MGRYINNSRADIYRAGEQVGILLVNLGTPDQPDTVSVRRYLAEFLSDPRIVESPRWLWKMILHGVILRIRPRRSAKAYRSIWQDQGSPLLIHSRQQLAKLKTSLAHRFSSKTTIALAMRYGQPSIASGLDELAQQGVTRLLILPLYPQYSATTTASIFDEVSTQLQKRRFVPELRFINHYVREQGYIQALANTVQQHWDNHGRADKLLLSFHGLPKRYVDAGDPYAMECQTTADLLAEALSLKTNEWELSFQSRMGREEWLQPYCVERLEQLPGEGVKSVDVICPGFSADCLETLEEIDCENRNVFLKAGGQSYSYIPALNDTEQHIEFLTDLLGKHLQGWIE